MRCATALLAVAISLSIDLTGQVYACIDESVIHHLFIRGDSSNYYIVF